MSKYKYLYIRTDMGEKDGNPFVNAHYLIGYCPQSITAYKEMLVEVQKDFPEATEESVNCHQISKSSYCQGFTLLTFNANVSKERVEAAKANGWYEKGRCDYYW